jgi:hypothetical protein
MSREKTIPEKDNPFHEEQKVIIETVSAHLSQWNIPAEWFNDHVLTAQTDWTSAWLDYRNPQTRTRIITFVKQEKRAALEKVLRQLVQMLRCNPFVSPDDLKSMGIAIRPTHRTPIAVPSTTPECETDTSLLRHLIIHFRDSGSRSAAKPHGVHAVEMAWGLLESSPLSMNDFPRLNQDTHTPIKLAFEEYERGKTVFFALRWVNTKGETGPWSDIHSAVVP